MRIGALSLAQVAALAPRSVQYDYLLRDFVPGITPDEAAPLASPRTCVPGPGTLTVVQTAGTHSVSGGEWVFSANNIGFSALGWFSDDMGWSTGKALLFRALLTRTASDSGAIVGVMWKTALDFNPNFTNLVAFRFDGLAGIGVQAGQSGSVANVSVPTLTQGVDFCVVAGEHPKFLAGSTLLWVGTTAFIAFHAFATVANADGKVSGLRVLDLSLYDSRFASDYGLATSRVAAADAGTVTTMSSDALVEATWTPAASDVYELSVRRTDDDNRWIVRCDQAAGTIKLVERNGGVETERSSAAQTWTVGTAYRVVAICDGTTIKTWVNSGLAKNTYSSATFNQTATGVKTSHAVTNLIVWPRYVTLPSGI